MAGEAALPPFTSCCMAQFLTGHGPIAVCSLGVGESESRSVVSDFWWPHGLHSPWNSPGQNIGEGSLPCLQEIVPTQGLNPGLLHCRWILYQLSHKGSPRILEWVGYPFSSGSSGPRNRTGVSCIAGRYFTNWAIVGWMVILPKGKNLSQPPEPMNAALFVKMFFGDMIHWKKLRWYPSCISRWALNPICCCCLVAE